MAIGTYISIITLNVGLNAPTKRHRLAEWIQKQDPYAVYKKPTSDLKTHTDWKWEDGKIYSEDSFVISPCSSLELCI